MIFDQARKFAFVHLPKTGGHSMISALADLLGKQTIYPGGHTHTTVRQVFENEIQREQWPDWFVGTTIRNPWAIVHSDYYYCLDTISRLSLGGSWRARVARVTRPRVLEAFVIASWRAKLGRVMRYRSFEAFVMGEYADRGGFWPDYCHLAGSDRIDFVCRLESIEVDFRRLCEMLNLEPPATFPWHNRMQGQRPDRRADYTVRARDAVADAFRYEIDRFGYDF